MRSFSTNILENCRQKYDNFYIILQQKGNNSRKCSITIQNILSFFTRHNRKVFKLPNSQNYYIK